MTRFDSDGQYPGPGGEQVDDFGERLSIAIKRAGGATTMARKAGVSSSVLRKWRRGESEPTRTSLIKMARAANVSVGWLATGEECGAVGVEGKEAITVELSLLERVAVAVFEELERRGRRLEPPALARLLGVLYRHFARHQTQLDQETIGDIIDLAALK